MQSLVGYGSDTCRRAAAATQLVVVCICTRDRPQGFARCLASVLSQALLKDLKDHCQLKVVVVDNSSTASERARILALASQNAPAIYVREPRPGIPFARNAALEAALKLGPEWIAFIDDDAVAPRGWLVRLIEIAETAKADVVQGALISVGAANIEDLAAARRPRDSVAKVRRASTAATNNVLFRTWIVDKPAALRFDENMQCGGSGGEFFMRAAIAGARLVRTSDAPVFEERSKEREAPSWLRRRAFRVGANCNYRYRKNRRLKLVAAALLLGRAAESAARGVLRALLSLLILPVSLQRASTLARTSTLDFCFAWGCVGPYFGIEPRRYA